MYLDVFFVFYLTIKKRKKCLHVEIFMLYQAFKQFETAQRPLFTEEKIKQVLK